jgi:hypothetical protein
MNPEKQKKTYVLIGKSLRYAMFAGLLFGVYTETGVWTTLLLALILLENELRVHLMSMIAEALQYLSSVVMRLVQKYQEDHDENNQAE